MKLSSLDIPPGLAHSLLHYYLLDEQMQWKVDSSVWDKKGVMIIKKRDALFLSCHTASLTRAEASLMS